MTIGISILFVLAVMASNWHGYSKGIVRGKYEGMDASLNHLIDTGRLDVLDAIEAEAEL
jgi:hypothetical protein